MFLFVNDWPRRFHSVHAVSFQPHRHLNVFQSLSFPLVPKSGTMEGPIRLTSKVPPKDTASCKSQCRGGRGLQNALNLTAAPPATPQESFLPGTFAGLIALNRPVFSLYKVVSLCTHKVDLVGVSKVPFPTNGYCWSRAMSKGLEVQLVWILSLYHRWVPFVDLLRGSYSRYEPQASKSWFIKASCPTPPAQTSKPVWCLPPEATPIFFWFPKSLARKHFQRAQNPFRWASPESSSQKWNHSPDSRGLEPLYLWAASLVTID